MNNLTKIIAISTLMALSAASCTSKKLEPIDPVKLERTVKYFTTTGWTTQEFSESITFADEVPKDAIKKVLGEYEPDYKLTQEDYRNIFEKLAASRR